MERSDLVSEGLAARKPGTADLLYEQMAAAALDFRALGVSEDWHAEIWELVLQVRKLIPASSPLDASQAAALQPQLLEMVARAGIPWKSPRQLEREQRMRRDALTRMAKRLRQIRENAWFECKLERLDAGDYRSRRDELAAALARRLADLDALRPTQDQVVSMAKGYMDASEFWAELERPSTVKERENALNVLVEMRFVTSLTSYVYSARVTGWSSSEKNRRRRRVREREELRKEILQETEEIARRAELEDEAEE